MEEGIEIWREVKGYEGHYEVSSQGRVRSLNYMHTGQTKVLKLRKSNTGYLRACLYKDGQEKYFQVHRLVAEAFIPNPGNLPQVNHINEGKTDNFVFLDEDGSVVPEKSNLEWCSPTYNINYGSRNERSAKANSRPVLQFDKSGNLVREWSSLREVERQTGWNKSCLSSCCHGKYKTAYGFLWRYSDAQ